MSFHCLLPFDSPLDFVLFALVKSVNTNLFGTTKSSSDLDAFSIFSKFESSISSFLKSSTFFIKSLSKIPLVSGTFGEGRYCLKKSKNLALLSILLFCPIFINIGNLYENTTNRDRAEQS